MDESRPRGGLSHKAGATTHLSPHVARTYRDALRDLRGVELAWPQALEELDVELRYAQPVERGLEPEVWAVTVPDRRLRVTARVVWWEVHASVLSVSVRAIEVPTLGEASWTQAALEEYAASRGARLATAEHELRAAIWDAKPVDVEVQPEHWRYRSGVDRIDVAILANRVDARGTRLVISASARELNAGGKPKARGRR